jgi:hypothetical protein
MIVSMPDPKQLPYLIQLIDDESPAVRDSVFRELRSFGPALEGEIARLKKKPSPEQLRMLEEVLEEGSRAWLRKSWRGWSAVKGEQERLEAALSLLAEYQQGSNSAINLQVLLDRLAWDFRGTGTRINALGLADFLFHKVGMKGVPQEDYYNPLNSNLVYVIEQKRGLPISLASVYILVGHRLGLQIDGCNFPGHFLTIASQGKRKFIVDCFNGGRVLSAGDLERVESTITLRDILRLKCQTPMIIARVLRNLSQAYELAHQEANQRLMEELLQGLEDAEVGS